MEYPKCELQGEKVECLQYWHKLWKHCIYEQILTINTLFCNNFFLGTV
uniref:Uncharacterized protein n=1 Tax=Anguilla anguilla TaxID=7936 RepID=A0A0E9WW45_ANGAN